VDQASKFVVYKYLPRGKSFAVREGCFYLTIVENKGTAFGLFSTHPRFFFFLCLGAVIFLFYYLFLKKKKEMGLQFPLALILAGAAGNLLDRLRLGFVIDFLDFRIWPVFNFADVFICTGIGIAMIKLLRSTGVSEKEGYASHPELPEK